MVIQACSPVLVSTGMGTCRDEQFVLSVIVAGRLLLQLSSQSLVMQRRFTSMSVMIRGRTCRSIQPRQVCFLHTIAARSPVATGLFLWPLQYFCTGFIVSIVNGNIWLSSFFLVVRPCPHNLLSDMFIDPGRANDYFHHLPILSRLEPLIFAPDNIGKCESVIARDDILFSHISVTNE